MVGALPDIAARLPNGRLFVGQHLDGDLFDLLDAGTPGARPNDAQVTREGDQDYELSFSVESMLPGTNPGHRLRTDMRLRKADRMPISSRMSGLEELDAGDDLAGKAQFTSEVDTTYPSGPN